MYDVLFTIRPEKGVWVVASPKRLVKASDIPQSKSKVEAIAVARQVALPVAPAVIEVYGETGFLDERIYVELN